MKKAMVIFALLMASAGMVHAGNVASSGALATLGARGPMAKESNVGKVDTRLGTQVLVK